MRGRSVTARRRNRDAFPGCHPERSDRCAQDDSRGTHPDSVFAPLRFARASCPFPLTDMRIAILDPFSGIAGDMTLGALIQCGLDPDWLRALPRTLGLDGVGVE